MPSISATSATCSARPWHQRSYTVADSRFYPQRCGYVSATFCPVRSMLRILSATLRIVALRWSRLSPWPVEHSENVADVADSGGPQEGGGETPPPSLARATRVPPPDTP